LKTTIKLSFLIISIFAAVAFTGCKQRAKNVIVMVISSPYRNEELILPETLLKNSGYKVLIASKYRVNKGMLGGTRIRDIAIAKAVKTEKKALIFVGGTGAQKYWDDRDVQQLAASAVNKGILTGAICLAPGILAKAGLLQGKKSTISAGALDVLEESGGYYKGPGVFFDGNIITASGPKYAKEFALKILEQISK